MLKESVSEFVNIRLSFLRTVKPTTSNSEVKMRHCCHCVKIVILVNTLVFISEEFICGKNKVMNREIQFVNVEEQVKLDDMESDANDDGSCKKGSGKFTFVKVRLVFVDY